MNDYRILHGDALTQLRTLPADSAHCVVTSPPYYGLRDYDTDGQIGLEPTVEAYVARLVEVFEECRRVLRNDGTFWLNLGDSYASNGGAHGGRADNQPGVGAKRVYANGNGDQTASGTTVAVAVGLGRHGIGIELNQDYISLAERRICNTQRPLL